MNTPNHPKRPNSKPDSVSDAPPNQAGGNNTEPNIPKMPKIISFETLARCGEEIWIENNGQIYRLRRTKQGKLILTK